MANTLTVRAMLCVFVCKTFSMNTDRRVILCVNLKCKREQTEDIIEPQFISILFKLFSLVDVNDDRKTLNKYDNESL